MELYMIYIGALVIVTSYFAFFYMWFNSLHQCIMSIDDKFDGEYVSVAKESPVLEALAHLSRKIDESIEVKSIPNTEDPREFFIKMGWDKQYIVRKKPRKYKERTISKPVSSWVASTLLKKPMPPKRKYPFDKD